MYGQRLRHITSALDQGPVFSGIPPGFTLRVLPAPASNAAVLHVLSSVVLSAACRVTRGFVGRVVLRERWDLGSLGRRESLASQVRPVLPAQLEMAPWKRKGMATLVPQELKETEE